MEEKKRSKSWFTWVSAMAVLIVVMGGHYQLNCLGLRYVAPRADICIMN